MRPLHPEAPFARPTATLEAVLSTLEDPSAAQPADEAVLAGEDKIEGRSLTQIAWARLRRDKVALAGGVFIIFLIVVAIFAPLIVKITGGPPNVYHAGPAGPAHPASLRHLRRDELGAPHGGRDRSPGATSSAGSSTAPASRCSSRSLATLLSVVIGTVIGIMPGFFGGWVDAVLSRLMDMFLAFPLLVFAIALAGVFPDKAFGLSGIRCGWGC